MSLSKRILNFCAVLLLLQFAKPMPAQNNIEAVYKHYNTEEGLPSSTVYCSFQDSEGFIWFGTSMGVSRFDGKNYLTFTTRDGLPDNEVFKIFEDSYKRIWLVCFNAFPCYIQNGEVFQYKNSALIRQIEEKDFGAAFIMADTGKSFWLTGSQNVYHIKKDTATVYPVNLDGEGTVYLNKTESGIYLFTRASIFKLDGDKFKKLQRINSFDNYHWGVRSFFFMKDTFATVTHNANGYGSDSINFFDFNKGKPQLLFSKAISTKFYCITILQNGEIIGGTSMGVKKINGRTGEITACDELSFLDGKQVAFIYEDTEGNLWCSTLGSGVYVIPPTGILKYKYNGETQLTSLLVDEKGVIFLGKNNAKIIKINNQVVSEIDLSRNMESTSRVNIASNMNENYLLFGTDRGAVTYDKSSEKLSFTSACNVKSMAVVDEKLVYLGISSGIVSFTAKNLAFDFLFRDTIRVTAMDLRDTGTLWYGTLNGLRSFKCKLPDFGKWNNIIVTSRINGIKHTTNGISYISTASSGLFIYDGENTICLNDRNGLSTVFIKKIFLDNKNRLWVVTLNGVEVVEYAKGSKQGYNIIHFNTKTGLPTNSINDIYVKGDTAWVISASEVFRFDVNIKRNHTPPRIYITEVLLSDSVVKVKSIKTDYKHNNLEIIYAGLEYTNQAKLQYKYILDGAGNDTVFTDLDRVNFSSLAPGKYKFYVWAQNGEGDWSTKPAALSMQVTPAFWQTWWFRVGIFALVIALIVMYFRSRIATLQKEQGLLRRIDELELMALKSQMNPHFVFNSLNSIQSFVNKNDNQAANKYLSSFGKLIRKTLDFSSKQNVTVEEEVSYLENYLILEKMRFSDKFDYFIEVDETELEIYHAEIPALILQPYVENAIRHGLRFKEEGTGILNIRFYVKGNNLYCEVEDNGIGRVKAEELKSMRHVEYQSKGMNLSGDRVEALNRLAEGGIKVEIIDKYDNNIATGTLIQLIIPLHLS